MSLASARHQVAAESSAASAHDGESVSQALRALTASIVELVSQWLTVVDLEARDALLRAAIAFAMAAAAVIFVAAAWVFVASAAVAGLVAGGVGLAPALLVVAGSNLALATVALWILWRSVRAPWFGAARRALGLSVGGPEPNDADALTD